MLLGALLDHRSVGSDFKQVVRPSVAAAASTGPFTFRGRFSAVIVSRVRRSSFAVENPDD